MPKKRTPPARNQGRTAREPSPLDTKNLQKRLAELESLYRTASVGIGLIDANLCYVHVNEKLAAFNGISAEAHVGRSIEEVLPAIADNITAVLRRVLQTGKPILNSKVKGTTPAEPGIERHWLVNYAPVTLDDGTVVGLSAVVIDVTELERTNEELRVYKRIVSAAPDHMSFVDTDFIYCAVSDAYLRAHDRQRHEIVGHSVAELLGEETFEDIVRPRLEECLAGREIHYQDWFSFPGIGRRFMDCRYSRFVTSDGTPGGVIVTARDFTERKKSEEHQQKLESQLREARALEAIGRLAAGVAHDVNSLLMVILGNSQLAEKGIETPSKSSRQSAQEALERIQESVGRGKTMVQSLLTFARVGASNSVANDLNRNVIDTIHLVDDLLSPTISIRSQLAPDLKPCVTDPGQMEQVILNLLLNARDAMPTGGRIVIETTNVELSRDYANAHSDVQAGEHVMLSVKDSGMGMDENTKARLFEPFFTTKKPGEGCGLGLSIVYGIVTQSKGHITVETAPGKGTVFRLYFPVADTAVE